MKKVLYLLALCAASVSAQDVIVKKDGTTILSKVLEVNEENVKYKKFTNLNGPTYTIEKDGIMVINYENGDKDFFSNENSNHSLQNKDNSSDTKYVQRSPSEMNMKLIESYNKRYHIGKKYKLSKKSVNSGLTTWGIAPSSVISNEDIEIEFEDRSDDFNFLQYTIIIKNRTNHTIYIDRGNSYRVSRDENFCYYNSGTQVVTSHGSGAGMSVNLGGIASAVGVGGILGTIAHGINVGGGASNTSGMTIGQQRFLVLPPQGRAALAQAKEIKGNQLERNERFVNSMEELNPPIHKGEVLNYNEDDSPYYIDYLITYSDNQNFTTYSVLNTRLYLKPIFGTHLNGYSIPAGGSFENVVKRRISDIDRHCIIGYIGYGYIYQKMQE